MRHINSFEDLEPQSEGFANRASETINIIGNVFEDVLNAFGGALADITGQNHGSHLRQNQSNIPFELLHPGLPLPQTPGFIEPDAIRIENFIEDDPRRL